MRFVAGDDDHWAALDHLCARGRVVKVADQNFALVGEVRKCHGPPKRMAPQSGARLTPGLAWNRLSGPLPLCSKRQTQAGFRRRQRYFATSKTFCQVALPQHALTAAHEKTRRSGLCVGVGLQAELLQERR